MTTSLKRTRSTWIVRVSPRRFEVARIDFSRSQPSLPVQERTINWRSFQHRNKSIPFRHVEFSSAPISPTQLHMLFEDNLGLIVSLFFFYHPCIHFIRSIKWTVSDIELFLGYFHQIDNTQAKGFYRVRIPNPLRTIGPPGNDVDRWLRYIAGNTTSVTIDRQHMMTIVGWRPRMMMIVVARIDKIVSGSRIFDLLIVVTNGYVTIRVSIESRYCSSRFIYICWRPGDRARTVVRLSKEVVVECAKRRRTLTLFEWQQRLIRDRTCRAKWINGNKLPEAVRKHNYLQNEPIVRV